jgi:hypothetical protein
MGATMRVTTTVRYRGLAVTVLGDVRVGLLAVAGYGTPQERAIAAIEVAWREGRWVYRLAGSSVWMAGVEDVAEAAVWGREVGL